MSENEAVVVCRCVAAPSEGVEPPRGLFFRRRLKRSVGVNRSVGAASAENRTRWFLVKTELNWKAKLSITESTCVPTLTYGHELGKASIKM